MKEMTVSPYRSPDGMVDTAFIYVYDATALTDGQTYKNVGLQLQDDSEAFVLRTIVGVDTVCPNFPNSLNTTSGRFNYRNANSSYALGNAGTGALFPPNWAVLPEKVYPRGSTITMDLYNVSRLPASIPHIDAFASYIGFSGVKRFKTGAVYIADTPPPYTERWQIFQASIPFNWTVPDPRPIRFSLNIDSFDFELMKISFDNSLASLANSFRVMLYGPTERQLFNIPIPTFLIWPATFSKYALTFPTPSLVYPANSNLIIEITQMISPALLPLTGTINIWFHGVWRMPK